MVRLLVSDVFVFPDLSLQVMFHWWFPSVMFVAMRLVSVCTQPVVVFLVVESSVRLHVVVLSRLSVVV